MPFGEFGARSGMHPPNRPVRVLRRNLQCRCGLRRGLGEFSCSLSQRCSEYTRAKTLCGITVADGALTDLHVRHTLTFMRTCACYPGADACDRSCRRSATEAFLLLPVGCQGKPIKDAQVALTSPAHGLVGEQPSGGQHWRSTLAVRRAPLAVNSSGRAEGGGAEKYEFQPRAPPKVKRPEPKRELRMMASADLEAEDIQQADDGALRGLRAAVAHPAVQSLAPRRDERPRDRRCTR